MTNWYPSGAYRTRPRQSRSGPSISAVPAFLGPLAPLTLPPGTIAPISPFYIPEVPPPVVEPIVPFKFPGKDLGHVVKLIPWGEYDPLVKTGLALIETAPFVAPSWSFDYDGTVHHWSCGSAPGGGALFMSHTGYPSGLSGTVTACIANQAIAQPPGGVGSIWGYWTEKGSTFDDRYTHLATIEFPSTVTAEVAALRATPVGHPARRALWVSRPEPSYRIPEPKLVRPPRLPPSEVIAKTRPRAPYTKERKGVVALPGPLGLLVGGVTETLDFMNCAVKALPYKYQPKPHWHAGPGGPGGSLKGPLGPLAGASGGISFKRDPKTGQWVAKHPKPGSKGGYWTAPTPVEWAQAIWKYTDKISIPKFVACIIANHLQDQQIGYLGGLSSIANRHKPGAGGYQIGPAL